MNTSNTPSITAKHPAVFVLAEIFWDDDAYGENLPKAALFRLTAESISKIDQMTQLIESQTLSDRGATVALSAQDLVFLRHVSLSEDGVLGSVPNFYDANKDTLIFLADAQDMEGADSESCEIYTIDDECQRQSGLKIQRIFSGFTKEICISVVGACSTDHSDWSINGFLNSWPNLKQGINKVAPALVTTSSDALQMGLALRRKAMALLQEAHETDGLKPFTVTHTHSYGDSTYVLWAAETPTQEEATAVLDCEFEPDRDESLSVEDQFSLEEIAGVTGTSRLCDLLLDAQVQLERPRG